MARPWRTQLQIPTRATAGVLSVMLHVGVLVLIALSGGRWDGPRDISTPALELVWLDARDAGRPEGVEQGAWSPAMPALVLGDGPAPRSIEAPSAPPAGLDIPFAVTTEMPLPAADVEVAQVASLITTIDTPQDFVMPQAQATALRRQLERLAEDLAEARRTRVSWQQDGRHYDAEIARELPRNGVDPERVIAEVSTRLRGRQLRTRISLRRLPYSHFAQVIDRWDPMVQLHDDEIVGRMHFNSRFNVLFDAEAAPRLFGRVTTAAGGFNLEGRSRQGDSDVFPEGIETRARHIPFAGQAWSFERTQHDSEVRIHELAGDTRIRFLGNGGYWWRDTATASANYVDPPAGQSVYFIAPRGATVFLRGVISGKFLVYSPERIVVEGDTTYARDPRSDPDSDDFLGLVSDKDIEVAPVSVTGPGDLHIQAALFAKRRVYISNPTHPRSATLQIFGSLAAGSLSESEPRYATKIIYDPRFEQLRPPGFPSMNRFATEDWDGEWTEMPMGHMELDAERETQ